MRPTTTRDRPEILLLAGTRGPGLGETLRSLRSRGAVTVAAIAGVLDRRSDGEVAATSERITAADQDRLIDAIERRAARRPYDAVITVADDTVLLAATVAARLGVRGLDPGNAHVFRDKVAQRSRLAAAGLPTPRFAECAADRIAGADFAFPLILKPARGSGGALAFVVTDHDQLDPILAEARAGISGAAAVDDDSAFIVEEVIVGSRWHRIDGFAPYVSVETAAVEGRRTTLGVTDRFPLLPPVLETGMSLPSSLSTDQQAEVVAIAEQALSALDFDQGISHTELMLTEDGPVVIEVNARAGGALPYLFPLAGGPDLTAVAADVALGHAPEPPVLSRQAVFVALQHPLGVEVEAVDGFDRIRALPEVRAMMPLTGAGGNTRSLQDTMAAVVLAETEDPMAAVDLHRTCSAAFEPHYRGPVTPAHYRRTPDGLVHPPHPTLTP